METIRVRTRQGTSFAWSDIQGEKTTILGIEFGVHVDPLGSTAVHVSELVSGAYLVKAKTREDALVAAQDYISKMGVEIFKDAVESVRRQHENTV